ncbi:hypothetical protein BKA80DRAFT_77323 [Phyllosticta citrichinensis]
MIAQGRLSYPSSHVLFVPSIQQLFGNQFQFPRRTSRAKLAKDRATACEPKRHQPRQQSKSKKREAGGQEKVKERKKEIDHIFSLSLGWWSTVVFLAFQLRGVCRSILIYSITGMMRVQQTDRQGCMSTLTLLAVQQLQGAARSGSETRYVVVIIVSHHYCVYVWQRRARHILSPSCIAFWCLLLWVDSQRPARQT